LSRSFQIYHTRTRTLAPSAHLFHIFFLNEITITAKSSRNMKKRVE